LTTTTAPPLRPGVAAVCRRHLVLADVLVAGETDGPE
jgi:hypothetical protein